MKKTMILFLTLLLSATLNSSGSNIDTSIEALYKYLGSKVRYPEQAKQNDIQGKSQLLFTLKEGKLTDVKIKTELGSGCDIEILNAILAYPNLKSLKSGKYALVSTFKLEGSTALIKNKNEVVADGYIALHFVIVGFAIPKQVTNKVEVQGYGNKLYKVSSSGNGLILRGSNGQNQPKVIVDSTEIAYDDMKMINPNEIQTIQILKGESAIATYGPEAINGVIVVTTKKTENKLIPKKQN